MKHIIWLAVIALAGYLAWRWWKKKYGSAVADVALAPPVVEYDSPADHPVNQNEAAPPTTKRATVRYT